MNFSTNKGLPACSSAPPRLIINWWRRVPRGTNGGVSALGLKAGAAGGALMGAAFWLTGGDPGFRDLAGHPGIAASAVGGAPVPGLLGLGTGARGRGLGWLLAAAALGAALGTLGTLLDSLLGATLQARHLLPTTLPPHVCGSLHLLATLLTSAAFRLTDACALPLTWPQLVVCKKGRSHQHS